MNSKSKIGYLVVILSAFLMLSCSLLPRYLSEKLGTFENPPVETATDTVALTATVFTTPSQTPSPTESPTVTPTLAPTVTITAMPTIFSGIQLETNAGIDFSQSIMRIIEKSYSEYTYLIITLSEGKLTDKDANELILENDSLIEELEAIPLSSDNKEETEIQRNGKRLLAKIGREYVYIDQHGINANSWDQVARSYIDTAEIYYTLKNECVSYVTTNAIPTNENDANLTLTGKLLMSINPLEPGLLGSRVVWYNLELNEEIEIKKFFPRYLIKDLTLSPDQEQIFVRLYVTDTADEMFKYGLMSSSGENYRDIPIEIGSGFLGFTPDSTAILCLEVVETNENGLSQEVEIITWDIETNARETVDQLTIYYTESLIAVHPLRDSIFFWTSTTNSENVEQVFLNSYKTRVIFGGEIGSVGTDFTLSDDGRIGAVSYLKKELSGIEIIDLGEGNNSLFTFSYQPIEDYDFTIRQGDKILAISPDNENILFSFGSNLYIYNRVQQTNQAITSCSMKDDAPIFSPDGNFLVYRSYCYFNSDTIIVDMKTMNFQIIMNQPDFNETTHAWIP